MMGYSNFLSKMMMAIILFDVMGVLLQSYPYAQNAEEEVMMMPYMDRLVEQLNMLGHDLFAVSHASETLLKKWSNQFDLFSAFKLVCRAQTYGGSKAEATFYKRFLAKQHLEMEQCFLIDDSLENIQAAQLAGLKAIHYKGASYCIQSLHDYGLLF